MLKGVNGEFAEGIIRTPKCVLDKIDLVITSMSSFFAFIAALWLKVEKSEFEAP